ncbi:hypothetical protein LAZ67_7002249 [Cordylochernes scorpioides]|uniref:Helix-turn-helix domain-containing protein n=1 Tax=Cordylochernes scorpioides TaxID=51811 RepID=A0ABY6KN48_9ARAC|nr:hypothetical protein LAZ67_7002249 [Cordylochernes scorpioides]
MFIVKLSLSLDLPTLWERTLESIDGGVFPEVGPTNEEFIPNPEIEGIILMFESCLATSNFSFEDQLFKQICGSPMGSPLSNIAAELVMSAIDSWILEQKHLRIEVWKRYLDDIFCICHKDDVLLFCHIWTFFFIKTDESYHTTVYYKKSIKPSYLLFDSYNPIGHKLTVVRTLTKRIHTHCSTPAFKKIEKTTIISNLTSRGYPLPFILRHSFNPSKHTQHAVNRNTCIIPYSFENQSIAHSLKKFGLRTFFTNHLSIGQILRNPITRSNIKKRPDQQPYAIYSIGCQDCNAKYVGETGRFIYNRISEHNRNIINKDPKSLIFQHTSKTGHAFNLSDPTCHYHNIKSKYQRLLIESFVSHDLNSINRRIELPSQYHSIRKKQPSPSFSPDPSSSSPV